MNHPPDTTSNVHKRRRLQWLWLMPAIMFISAAIWLTVDRMTAVKSLERAKTFLKQRRDVEAEQQLERYLKTFPGDHEAILMWAQAVVGGDSRTPWQAATLATERLQLIPDDSEFGGEARMREGRLTLLILRQADRAEKLLVRSTGLDAKLLDSHYLLWKLFDMTERFQFSETHFWRTFELTPESGQAERLREWYVSQFSPTAANAELDRHMGFLKIDELPSEETDITRLEEFYSSEPQSPMVVAAMGQWYLRNRQREDALQVLKGISPESGAMKLPFYVSTLVSVLLDLGSLEEARTVFQEWPHPGYGYDYWIAAGRIRDLADRNNEAAIKAYDRALAIWPGQVDWPTMHRKSQCLARQGNKAAADTMREQSRSIELMMEPDVHQRLRAAMADLENPSTAAQMSEFYAKIRRDREAAEWRKVFDRLSTK